MRYFKICLSFLLLASFLWACGAGVPVRVRVDEAVVEFNISELLDKQLGDKNTPIAVGPIQMSEGGFPEKWPADYPTLKKVFPLPTPPSAIDLSAEKKKYKEINKAEDVIRRIEINRLILRMEQNTLTVQLPDLELQIADDKDTTKDDPEDLWVTVGRLRGAEPKTLEDIDFEWVPGGESYLNSQLADDEKQFAIRTKAQYEINTDKNPWMPHGQAVMRLIIVVTFFLMPEQAL